MDKLSLADARQLFLGCLLLYKGELVYVASISVEFNARVVFLETQKAKTVPFNTLDFKAIGNRLGFVNTNCAALFVFRKPVRLFSVGLNTNNLGIEYSRECNLGPDPQGAINKIKSLQCPDLVNTINGEYPGFNEAQTLAKEFEGSYAFDRQFAVDATGFIFYRNKCVGESTGKTVEEIKFYSKFYYLNLLLKGKYEKHPRDFRIE